jgi:hypothetical protein
MAGRRVTIIFSKGYNQRIVKIDKICSAEIFLKFASHVNFLLDGPSVFWKKGDVSIWLACISHQFRR